MKSASQLGRQLARDEPERATIAVVRLSHVCGRFAALPLALAACVDGATNSVDAPPLVIEREWRIDGSEHDLTFMGDIVVLPGGSVAVNQSPDANIRVFSAEGRPLKTVGRKGDGPGEFQVVRYIGLAGDSLWAYDARRSRITHFTPDFTVARVVNFSTAQPGPEFSATLPPFPFVYLRAAYPGGEYLILGGASTRTQFPAGYPRGSTPLLRINDSSVIRAVVAWERDDSAFLNVVLPNGSVYGTGVPFKQPDLTDAAPDGTRIATATAAVRDATEGTFAVTMLDASGDTVFLRAYPFEGIRIPAELADSAWKEAVEGTKGDPPEVLAALRAAGPVPSVYPPLLQLIVGRDGSAWLRMRKPGLEPEERFWLILDPAGEPYGSVIVPRNIFITTVDLSNIWAFEFDDNDVQSIVRFRLAR